MVTTIERPTRWSSETPLGFEAGDTNLRRYVGNSPPNATDPSGLEVKVDHVRLKNAGLAILLTQGGDQILIESSMPRFQIDAYAARPDVRSIIYHGDAEKYTDIVKQFEGPDVTTRRINLSIAFTGDWKVNTAAWWNGIGSKTKQQCLKPGETSKLDELAAWLERQNTTELQTRVDVVYFSSHGSFGSFAGGTFSVDVLKDKKSSQYKLLKQLSRLTHRDTLIDIRACSVADGRSGKELLQLMADITGAHVRGYTDVYAVVPHGDEYTAYPGKAGPTKTAAHPPYDYTRPHKDAMRLPKEP